MLDQIGIIGGTGQIGQMFTEAFRKIGKQVLISDIDSIEQEENLVKNSQLIIISVTIGSTQEVIERIQSFLTNEQLLMDFTSVKNQVIPQLLATKAQIISAHPMFGFLPDMTGQNIILLPIRTNEFLLSTLKTILQTINLNVVCLENWQKHDQYMSFIQGLMHFFHIVFTKTLKLKNVDLSKLLEICSPIYQANFAFTCRILSRDPDLYSHILIDNPENINVLQSFINNAQQSLDLIKDREIETFKEEFQNFHDYLGDFAEKFNQQSNYLIQKLKEYE